MKLALPKPGENWIGQSGFETKEYLFPIGLTSDKEIGYKYLLVDYNYLGKSLFGWMNKLNWRRS